MLDRKDSIAGPRHPGTAGKANLLVWRPIIRRKPRDSHLANFLITQLGLD